MTGSAPTPVSPPPAPTRARLPAAPQDLDELRHWFSDPLACDAYLDAMRYSVTNGFRCQRCGSTRSWFARSLRECSRCGRQVSPTSLTSLHMLKIPRPLYCEALWWFVNHNGIPKLQELRAILRARNHECSRPLLARLGAGLADHDGVAICAAAFHYSIAGHHIILGTKPVSAGGHKIRLFAVDRQVFATMTLNKYLRTRLKMRGPAARATPAATLATSGMGTSAPASLNAPSVESFPHEMFVSSLKRRLQDGPTLSPQYLQLVLNVFSFQWNYWHHDEGHLWRAALLYALRPVFGRGLPPWPPPCDLAL